MKIPGVEVFLGGPGKNYVTLKLMTDEGIHGLVDATLNNRGTLPAAYVPDFTVRPVIPQFRWPHRRISMHGLPILAFRNILCLARRNVMHCFRHDM